MKLGPLQDMHTQVADLKCIHSGGEMVQYIRWISILRTHLPSGDYLVSPLDVGYMPTAMLLWEDNHLTSLGSIAFGCNMTLKTECQSCNQNHPQYFIVTKWEAFRTRGKSMGGIGTRKQSKSYGISPNDSTHWLEDGS